MKRLAWIALTASLLAACDPGDESLGDTGGEDPSANSSTSGLATETTGETGEPEPDETTGTQCGQDGGCGDSFLVELSADVFPEGTYEVALRNGSDDSNVDTCTFTLPYKGGGCVWETSEGSYSVSLLPGGLDFNAENRLTVTYEGGIAYDELQAFDFEVQGDACWSCNVATVAVQVAEFVAGCESLEEDFDAAFLEVRSCTEASECGTVLEGTSCGCTRNWIGRLDTDPQPLFDAMDAGQAAKCEWAMFGGVCDCPEAEGFDCIDNICTWNYVDQ